MDEKAMQLMLSKAAEDAQISAILILPKELAKGLKEKAIEARGKCTRGGFMFRDRCTHLEDVLVQCGDGLSIGANKQLECGGTAIAYPADKFKQTQAMEAEADILRGQHNMRVAQLRVAFSKKISDSVIDAKAHDEALKAKITMLQNRAIASKASLDLKALDLQKQIAQQELVSKTAEKALKLQQAISIAFPKLMEETFRRLNQLAKSRRVLLSINFNAKLRLAGLSTLPQPKATTQGLSLMGAAPKKRRRTTRRKKYVRRA